MNANNIPQEIIEKATRLSNIKGARFSFEQNVEMLMAEKMKKEKKSLKDGAKWTQRKNVSAIPQMTGEQRDAYEEKRKTQIFNASSDFQK